MFSARFVLLVCSLFTLMVSVAMGAPFDSEVEQILGKMSLEDKVIDSHVVMPHEYTECSQTRSLVRIQIEESQ